MPKLLIANRGEIALRIMRTAKQHGYITLAIFSDADRDAPHVAAADIALPIGGSTPQESYLDIDKIIAAAHRGGADCVHPGYGFLSENARFARACEQAGLTFIGPSAEVIELMGNKRRAKQFAMTAGLPCIPGFAGSDDDAELRLRADEIGYPLMLKAAAGGGGRGMRIAESAQVFDSQLKSARAESLAAFGNDEIILEKVLNHTRHIEIQVFADQYGNCIHLGERDCSVQRRHQKVVEEAPSPAVAPALRKRMGEAAVALAKACHYTGAGTVEFLLDSAENFYFLEMNTRLQVEHGVTELITGTDLVAWQLAVSRGDMLPLTQSEVALHGHAIEVRLYAEDPNREFLPQSGIIHAWEPIDNTSNKQPHTTGSIRFDHALKTGLEVSPYYDPMLGKLMAWGESRGEARNRLASALAELPLIGPRTNRFFLQHILEDSTFAAGAAHTGYLTDQFSPRPLLASIAQTAMALAAALLHHLSLSPYDVRTGRANWHSNGFTAPWQYRISDSEKIALLSMTASSNGSYQVIFESGEKEQIELPCHPLNPIAAQPHPVWINGRQRLVQWSLTGKKLTLIYSGQQWDFSDQTYAPAEVSEVSGSGDIRAPMQGNLTQVCIEVGARVKRGDLVATMEAMKMEHNLKADCDGTVRDIAARAGDQVRSGQKLIRIESAREMATTNP